jgi:hypothetical protein
LDFSQELTPGLLDFPAKTDNSTALASNEIPVFFDDTGLGAYMKAKHGENLQ